MRKVAVLVTTGLLLAGTSITSPAAWANGGNGGDFTLTGEFTDFDTDDRGKEGFSEDDEFTFAFDLFDHDDEAGDGDGECKLTNVERRKREFDADCKVALNLDDGDIEAEDEVTSDDFRDGKVTLSITGGSGDYDDAEGDVTFWLNDHHDRDGRGRYHHEGHDRGDDDGRDFKVEVDLD
jgi:hypothetical protein